MLPEDTCTLYCHGPYDLSEIHCQRLTTKAGGSISVGIFHSQLPEKVATGGGLTWNVTCCTRSSFATGETTGQWFRTERSELGRYSRPDRTGGPGCKVAQWPINVAQEANRNRHEAGRHRRVPIRKCHGPQRPVRVFKLHIEGIFHTNRLEKGDTGGGVTI
jgi:hypothetical protein